MHLVDEQEKDFSLDQLRGKPTLVEIVAMSCAGCQAFSGGNQFGGFGGFPAQDDLKSIEHYVKDFGKTELFSDKINFVQIIIYNLQLKAPTPKELGAWRSHFHLNDHPNTFILSGGEPLASRASFYMIPGFLLLDSNLKVLFDATGHQPKYDLYRQLLPGLANIQTN